MTSIFRPRELCPAGPECITLPGPDGILGTADDKPLSLANFTRQIQIDTVLEADGVTINPNLKQITVTVSYSTERILGSALLHGECTDFGFPLEASVGNIMKMPKQEPRRRIHAVGTHGRYGSRLDCDGGHGQPVQDRRWTPPGW